MREGTRKSEENEPAMTRKQHDGVDRTAPASPDAGGCGAVDHEIAMRRRVVEVATYVEYEVLKRVGFGSRLRLFDRGAPWVDDAAAKLADPRARLQSLVAAIVMQVVDDCARDRSDHDRLALMLTVLERVEGHRPLTRALIGR